MATLTRPPLLLAVIAVAATARWPLDRRTFAGAAIIAAFTAALVAIQWRLYGHPLMSGYGSAGSLFALGAIPGNTAVHLKWLTINYTPLAFVAFAAGARRDRRLAVRAVVTLLAVALPYALYASRFDDWEVTRFLLPGWVFVLLVCASGVTGLTAASRGSTRPRPVRETNRSISWGQLYQSAGAAHRWEASGTPKRHPGRRQGRPSAGHAGGSRSDPGPGRVGRRVGGTGHAGRRLTPVRTLKG
jgi:hypothetical protein